MLPDQETLHYNTQRKAMENKRMSLYTSIKGWSPAHTAADILLGI